jgi:NitT/TauT family transport system permease protein
MASTTTTPARPPGARARRTGLLYTLAGVAALLIGWELLSLFVNPAIMASPAATIRALADLAWGKTLWIQLLITLERLVIGLAVGAAVGWVLGVAAGLEPRLRSFLEPLRWVGMTTPVVILAILAAIWFGLSDFTVIFVVTLIVLPIMYVNTLEGVLAIDRRLVEMGRVYRFPRGLLLREIYLPGVASPAIAGLTLATGIAVRAVVLAEVLAATSGIGHAFVRANSLLETPQLFAWVLVLLALMAVIEFGVLRPVRRRAMRWRKAQP